MVKNKRTLTLFGIQVKKRLIDLGMTQKQLADEIGLNTNYLTDILNGRRSGIKYRDRIIEKLNLEEEIKREESMKGVV